MNNEKALRRLEMIIAHSESLANEARILLKELSVDAMPKKATKKELMRREAQRRVAEYFAKVDAKAKAKWAAQQK